MWKCVLAQRFVVLVLGLFATGLVTVLYAQSPAQAANSGGTGGARNIEEGQPLVMVHPTVEGAAQAREAHNTQKDSTASNLSYQGGTSDGPAGTVGVETTPKIYLVLWGSQWSSDPSGEEAILVSFFRGVSASAWQNTVTQYCQGVASGTVFCNGAGTAAGNQTGSFVAAWYDNSHAAPKDPRQSQLAAEAKRAAAFFGNTTTTSNASVQYVIATAHGYNATGFGTQYCAWHSWTNSSYGDLSYTNLPYITDGGASCGADFNGLGDKAGITIVAGHEMAETITDQFWRTGWADSNGSEIGDKCTWISSGQGATANVTLSTGTFPVQSLWSNAFNSGVGGCVLSY